MHVGISEGFLACEVGEILKYTDAVLIDLLCHE